MPIRRVFVVRHGDYNPWGEQSLTPDGAREVENTARIVRSIVGGDGEVRILTSIANRAVQTAGILGRVLDVIPDSPHEALLSSGGGVPRNMPEVVGLIDGLGPSAGVVVLSTHFEFARSFPSHWGLVKLDGAALASHVIDKGRAWHIDCEAKSLALI